MSASTKPKSKAPTAAKKLVEMNWDPITRIAGSLGIFTKIVFDNKQVAECYSTSSIFRGYSIFMKGKDPRDAHFIIKPVSAAGGTIKLKDELKFSFDIVAHRATADR